VTGIVLLLAPTALLVLALLLGRYPGERTIERLRARRFGRGRARRRSKPARLGRRRSPASMPRGGRLVAAAIAARPPPAG